jgi:hypothetical protein
LSRFESQRKIYEQIHNFEAQIAEAKLRKQNFQKQSLDQVSSNGQDRAHSDRQPILADLKLPSNNNCPSTSRSQYTGRSSNHSTSQDREDSSATARTSKGKEWYQQRTEVLKVMSEQNPQIIQEYRAKRAANYINKYVKPSDLPGSLSTTSESARQRGSLDSSRSSQIPYHLINTSASVAKEQLHQLIEDLSKTEEEIERQELKISLHSRRKHYEAPTNAAYLNMKHKVS